MRSIEPAVPILELSAAAEPIQPCASHTAGWYRFATLKRESSRSLQSGHAFAIATAKFRDKMYRTT